MKPRIGIRPIIDGRQGGIREGLEEQTRKMAAMAKELIESNLFYTDGTPAEAVVFDGTIGGRRGSREMRGIFFRFERCRNAQRHSVLMLRLGNDRPLTQ